MSWWDRYVGVPFMGGGRTIKALDCWGLVRLIYAEQLGIDLPDYGEVSASDLLAIARTISDGQEAWTSPETPVAFDGVMMRWHGQSWIGHVGIMIDNRRLIHVEEVTAVVVVPLNHFTVRHRIVGFRRHRSKSE